MDKKSISYKRIVIITFLLFLIVHGEMIFNKISWHDDVALIYTGFQNSLEHGRWMYAILHKFIQIFPGYESTPVLVGAEVAFLIAMIAILIMDMYGIYNEIEQFSVLFILVSIPAVTGNLGYMVTAAANFLGILICVLGAYIACKGIEKRHSILSFFLSSTLFAIALGEYQCYFALYITLIIIYLIRYVLKNDIVWLDYFKTAIYYLGTMISGLVMYLAVLQICLFATDTKMTEYAGTNTYGIVNISEYISRIKIAYYVFLFGKYQNESYTMVPFSWIGWRIFGIVVLGLLCIIIVSIDLKKRKYKNFLQFILLLVVIPIAFDFIFILYDENNVHSLHMYQYILFYILIIILGNIICEKVNIGKHYILYKIIKRGVIGVLLLYGILYFKYDSGCYMDAEIKQEQAVVYFSNLILRIQAVDNYKESYPVVFINETGKNNYGDIEEKRQWTPTNPYNINSIINTYNWKAYMKTWCNYSPQTIDSSLYDRDERVMNMPSYPDADSICIIDNVIVVKF